MAEGSIWRRVTLGSVQMARVCDGCDISCVNFIESYKTDEGKLLKLCERHCLRVLVFVEVRSTDIPGT